MKNNWKNISKLFVIYTLSLLFIVGCSSASIEDGKIVGKDSLLQTESDEDINVRFEAEDYPVKDDYAKSVTEDNAEVQATIPEDDELKDNEQNSELENIRLILNRIECTTDYPVYSEDEDLNNKLDLIMPEILKDTEDTFDKIKACYDYLIDNCKYSETTKYTYEKDAYILLTENKGSCTYYASALHFMLLYIGVENEIISGYRYPAPGAEPSFHRWNEITIDGEKYILDSQWDDVIMKSYKDHTYRRFALSYNDAKEYYCLD